jgi:hypothetical protein
MELKEAENIFEILRTSYFQSFVEALLKSAIRYSRLRVDWYLTNQEQRREMEEERTIAHNAFISACDILSRNMKQRGEDYKWRFQIGNNRKSIGDFACLLHAVMGIKAR